MSAFIVGVPHLRALTHFAFAHEVHDLESFADQARPGEGFRNAFGRLLLEQNSRSMRHRYEPDVAAARIGPGPATFDAGPQDVRLQAPLVILKACSCYDYQACETEDYHRTWASAAIDRIRRAACGELLQDLFRSAPDLPGWPLRSAEPEGPRFRLRVEWIDRPA